MRKTILIIGLSLMTLTAFSQKKEIRKASRSLDKGEYSLALSELDEAESLLTNMNDEAKAEFYFLKAKATYNVSNQNTTQAIAFLNQANSFKPSTAVSGSIAQFTAELTEALINSAIEDQNASNNVSAADKLMTVYSLNEADNKVYLYYAASNYHNAGELEKALAGYKTLLADGYTGVETQLFAVDKETGEKQAFGSVSERKLMIQSGAYTDPTDEETEDLTPKILHYISYIYIAQDKYDDAIKVIDDVLVHDSDNVELLRNKADLLYQLDKKAEYKQLMKRIVSLDPKNPELLFNLAVSSSELGEKEEAIDFYEQVLALDANHYAANLNLAVSILSGDEAFVVEMNSLGLTPQGQARYQELQEERKDLMQQVVPYLEKALQIDSSDVEVMRTLANVYSQIGENDKADALYKRISK